MSQPQRDVALITGATGNLGRALAQVVQEESMPCILLDRNADKLRTLYGEDTNDRRIVAADVLDEVALNEGLASVVAELGQITILLNTVGGFAMGHPVHETEPSQLDHL